MKAKARFVSKIPSLKIPIHPGRVEVVATSTGNVRKVKQPEYVEFVNHELITEDPRVIGALREKIDEGLNKRWTEEKTHEQLAQERDEQRRKLERKILVEKYHICPLCKWSPKDDAKNPGAALNQHIRHNHPENYEKIKSEGILEVAKEEEEKEEEVKTYECKKCGQPFTDLEEYKSHNLTAHRDKRSKK